MDMWRALQVFLIQHHLVQQDTCNQKTTGELTGNGGQQVLTILQTMQQ